MKAAVAPFVYRLSLQAFALGARVMSLWSQKARLWMRGRRGWRKRLQDGLGESDQPLIWFHAASVGEFEQARPLIEGWKQRWPDHRILVTFFSPSGFELRKHYDKVDLVAYLPLDSPRNAHDFLSMAKPALAVFVKYEFWHYYYRELRRRSIPLLHVCTILRPGQRFFRRSGGFHRESLESVSEFFVQNSATEDLLRSIGISSVSVVGDTRADRVAAIVDEPFSDPIVAAFRAAEPKPVLILGSVWPADLQQLEPALHTLQSTCRLIVAPHELHESEIAAWCDQWEGAGIRYTKSTPQSAQQHPILVIDTIGTLSRLYRYADLAYIGGAFGKGLHNTLEPAAYGLPIAFGPRFEKFQEAQDLVARGAAVSCENSDALTEILVRWIGQPSERQAAGAEARAYVRASQGASEKILARAAHYVEAWKA